MKVTYTIIITALVLAHVISFYQYAVLSDSQLELAAEFDLTIASFEKEKAQIEKAHQADIARLEGSLSSLARPITADEVAASLIKVRKAKLITWVAEKLANEDKYVNKLRGPKGGTPKPPSTENVAALLASDGPHSVTKAVAKVLMDNSTFKKQVRGRTGPAGRSPSPKEAARYLINYKGKALFGVLEQEFWRKRKSFILKNPGLIADTAEAVYLTYGKNLQGQKGQDAQTPSLEEIAHRLSNDYEFAQLVADFIKL